MKPMETILAILLTGVVAFQAGQELGEWREKNARKKKPERKNQD